MASEANRRDIVAALLDAGAKPSMADPKVPTPFSVCGFHINDTYDDDDDDDDIKTVLIT
jgi:hypothetical protein